MSYYNESTPISAAMSEVRVGCSMKFAVDCGEALQPARRRGVCRLVKHFTLCNMLRNPRDIGGLEAEAMPSMLAARDNVSARTQNRALSALLFFFREVLSMDLPCMEWGSSETSATRSVGPVAR